MPQALTGKQRRALRALGHHLKPVVHVGQDDLTDGVLQAVDEQLGVHELIKVKIGEQLAEKSASELVQILGRTLLLYRRHPEKPKILI